MTDTDSKQRALTMTTNTALYEALAAAQAELKNPSKTKKADTGKYTYNYADIGDVLEACLPVLSKHGLSVMQPTVVRDGAVILITRLAHISGQTVESEYPVCSINGNHQAMGSAMTYARRYALTSLIGITAVDDTDGKDAAPSGEGPRKQMSVHQAKQEVDWNSVENSIRTASSHARLDKLRETVQERKGLWPDSYYVNAIREIEARRADIAVRDLRDALDRAPDDAARTEIWLAADTESSLQDYPDHQAQARDIYHQSLADEEPA